MTGAGARRWLTLFLLGIQTGTALAAILRGQVVRVVDGDTLVVADGRHRKVKVRLSGIDAPEKDQPYGRQSKVHLASLVLGKTVDVDWDKRDTYGRVIGRVLLAPGNCPDCEKQRDVGLAQVRAGYAWWYRSESRELTRAEKSRYALVENGARARQSGLWAAPKPIAPWEWRHNPSSQASSPLAKTAVRIRKARTFIRHPVSGVRHWINS